MPDRKSSSTSNSSRTAAKVAVVVLIVIAIAGFVLAGLKAGKSAPEQVAAADPTQEQAVAPTAGAAPAAPAAPEEPAVPGAVVVDIGREGACQGAHHGRDREEEEPRSPDRFDGRGVAVRPRAAARQSR